MSAAKVAICRWRRMAVVPALADGGRATVLMAGSSCIRGRRERLIQYLYWEGQARTFEATRVQHMGRITLWILPNDGDPPRH